MNHIAQDSEKGFTEWLKSNGWEYDKEDYYINVGLCAYNSRINLHGLFIAEMKTNTNQIHSL